MTNVASIYIPRMSAFWVESGVKDVMRRNFIGRVSHVDFTPINKQRGFGEDVCSGVMSAFVHFTDPVCCADASGVESNTHWDDQFWKNIVDGAPYKLQVTKQEYWVCLKNIHPVNRTRMNIHQVVDNCRHLEGVVASQAVEIAALKKSVDNVIEVVYGLLGGLYSQRTQAATLTSASNHLGIFEEEPINLEQLRGENHWPTTRQGDQHTIQIRNLEQELRVQMGHVAELDRRLMDQEINRYREEMPPPTPYSIPEAFPYPSPYSPDGSF